MTTHSFHEDSHTHGLADDCERCQEHAEHPETSLDRANLERLLAGEIHTRLDRVAADRLKAGRVAERRVGVRSIEGATG
jgi:hypothetical protein